MAKRRRAKDNQNSEDIKQSEEDGSKKLAISDSLKAALMTHMDVSPEQIDALVKEAGEFGFLNYQEQGAENWNRKWWFYLMFPVFEMFLLAKLMMSSHKYLCTIARIETWYKICDVLKKAFVQVIVWWFSWTRVFMLQATYFAGALLLPLYKKALIHLDADYNSIQSQRKRVFSIKRHRKGYQLLTLARRLCVYMDVYNVYGKDLV